MKKYKVHFSIFNLFHETQAEVAKLQTMIKGISATAIGTTYAMSNVEFAFYVSIGSAIIDTLITCFYFEEIK
jgi:hypothetical protein